MNRCLLMENPLLFSHFDDKIPYIFLHRCRTLSFSGDPPRSYQDASTGWERKPAAEDQLCGTVTGCGEWGVGIFRDFP